MKTALTIAGSDSSGGAGIQADLKAMTMNGVFAMSAITALTAQNTTGVSGIFEVSPEFLAQQIDAVFTDIRPCAVKIGMVSSAPLIETIAERLRFYKAEHIVVDPVMVATSGSDLIASDAVRTLRRELFPLAEVITPNRHEAEVPRPAAPGVHQRSGQRRIHAGGPSAAAQSGDFAQTGKKRGFFRHSGLYSGPLRRPQSVRYGCGGIRPYQQGPSGTAVQAQHRQNLYRVCFRASPAKGLRNADKDAVPGDGDQILLIPLKS